MAKNKRYIKIKYRDSKSEWEWKIKEGTFSSPIELLNLVLGNEDCDYEIVEYKKDNWK